MGKWDIKRRLKRFKSMRAGLFLLLVTVTGLALAGVTAGTLLVCRRQAVDGRVGELQDYGRALANQISGAGFPAMQGSEINAELSAAADVFGGRIVVVDSNLKVISDTYNYEVGKILIAKTVIESVRGVSSQNIEKAADYVVYIPQTNKYFTNSLAIIPLQLFSYYVSVGKGCDVDKPRNLAKSVTVE